MRWFRFPGEYGVLIVAVTAVFVAVACVALRSGVRRHAAVGFLLAAALPTLLGAYPFVELALGFANSDRATPKELADRYSDALSCLMLGAAGSALSMIVAVLVHSRSREDDETPGA